MKVIDAFTGRVVDTMARPDPSLRASWVKSPPGSPGPCWRLLDVDDRFFRVWGLIEFSGSEREPEWLELQVRFTHPKYFLERVAFVPT